MDEEIAVVGLPKLDLSSVATEKDEKTTKEKTANILWGLDEDQKAILMDYYGFLLKLEKYDSFYLPKHKDDDIHPLVYYLRWTFIGSVIALAIYQTAYTFFYVFRHADYSAMTALTIVELNWSFQAILSTFFILHWKSKNYFRDLLQVTHKVNKSASHEEAKTWIYFVLKITLGLSITVFIVALFTIFSGYSEYTSMLDTKAMMGYGSEKLIPLHIFIFAYTFIVWIDCMSHYTMYTIMVYFESEYFNRQLATVGKNGRETGEELLEFYLKHCQLANVIYQLDRTFEVYTFAMIGSNIPTTIFSLLAFFMNLRVSWVAAVFTFPSCIVCVMSLIGLTAVPAKLHASVARVEKILYSNKSIWTPFCEKTYQIAQVFITHVNQTNLGVSVWGFAVVSKPLILTTISATITYLSFILQLKADIVPVGNSTLLT
ncbi:hypothetical protein L596_013460 [Steinernema carpocapsae]|uniref:Gustatory receptor n=1 Tax=Steinernema carpocapsae TaxID=34508 RepID=A0A4U5P075_STECR|nr:hypothetical protein L596_013460 [Steinernema carpocapsae]